MNEDKKVVGEIKIDAKLISELPPLGFVNDWLMAAMKKEGNKLAQQWNEIFGDDKIKITPLTEEEERRVELFEKYIKRTREIEQP